VPASVPEAAGECCHGLPCCLLYRPGEFEEGFPCRAGGFLVGVVPGQEEAPIARVAWDVEEPTMLVAPCRPSDCRPLAALAGVACDASALWCQGEVGGIPGHVQVLRAVGASGLGCLVRSYLSREGIPALRWGEPSTVWCHSACHGPLSRDRGLWASIAALHCCAASRITY
jgi:hypothetical protein